MATDLEWKLDRRALPAPDDTSLSTQPYAPPAGPIEVAIAAIWAQVLGVDRVGRDDHFFALGGHSLLALRVLARMRSQGLRTDVRSLLTAPTLAGFASSVEVSPLEGSSVEVSPLEISAVEDSTVEQGDTRIPPDLVSLIDLDQDELEAVIATVSGGAENLQDIYPLAPLQEGILFHSLTAGDTDPYIVRSVMRFTDRARFDRYRAALDVVIARHDILRTGIVWAGLAEPVQAVWRQATVAVDEVVLDPAAADPPGQLLAHATARYPRLALHEAPLLRLLVADDPAGDGVLAAELTHHIIDDNTSLKQLNAEVHAVLAGRVDELPAPLPFRDFVAATRATDRGEHAAFFRQMLAGIDEPTAPFGRLDIFGDGAVTRHGYERTDAALTTRLRSQAAIHQVSVASLVHVAWAQVLARTTGRDDVVFGTVLFGRMHDFEGSDRILGPFINTLPLRVELGAVGVAECVVRTHGRLSDLLSHEYASLALVQQVSGVRPLFTTVLNFRHTALLTESTPAGSSDGVTYLAGVEHSNYPLTLDVDDTGDDLWLTVAVSGDIDAVEVAAMTRRALETLAGALETAPTHPIGQLDILPPAERHRLVTRDNEQTVAYPRHRCVHHLFEAQAARDPHAVALVVGAERLTYAELNARANRLAHHLSQRGVGPDRSVAICVGRSVDMVVSVLAVWKAGGAYVPLDPAYPLERLKVMARDSSPVVVLVGGLRDEVRGAFAGRDIVDLDVPVWSNQPATNLRGEVTAGHLAYVIYTSGTTGVANGVQVEHAALMAIAGAWSSLYQLRPGLVHAQMASFSFDVFTADVVRSLCFGGTLLVCPRDLLLDPAALYALLRRSHVTIADFVPAVLSGLASYAAESGLDLTWWETLICGSDVWSLAGAHLLRQLCGPSVRIVHAYGVTEATVDATFYLVPLEVTRLPIGRALPNTRIYLLDAAGEPVPDGVVGEIFIGGAGVARGYLNRPELTAARFTASRLVPGDRLYRTGDLARRGSDGEIELIGRADLQVKVRGFRVELGEVEAHLADYPSVREAVVVARPSDRLVAYIMPVEGATVDASALRDRLASVLPVHLVPSAYVPVEAWPLTLNGKLDRAALPDPTIEHRASAADSMLPLRASASDPARELRASAADSTLALRASVGEPVGPMETAIAALWTQLLGVEPIGRHDNFFDLGGHSLLSMRLVAKVRQTLGRELSPAMVFAAPTLAAFAERVAAQGHATVPPIEVSASHDGPAAVSFAAQRLWFVAQLGDAGRAYHMPNAFELRGVLNRAALTQALDALVSRHEVLRTRFVDVDGEVAARVDPLGGFTLLIDDLTDASERLGEVQAEEAAEPFDVATGALVRGRLVILAPDRHVLLLTLHHIVCDGWSIGVLTRELATLYTAFDRGEPDPLPPLPIQYADYAAWQRRWLTGDVLARELGFWRDALSGAPALLELPTDRPRPLEQDVHGGVVPVEIDAELTAALTAVSRRYGVTLFMTLLAAWALVLARLSGQTEIVVGAPTANRRRAEFDELIGFFVNTLALRVDLAGEPSAAQVLERVRAVTLAALDHQDVPFEQVVEALNPARRLGHTPVFQTLFVWQDREDVPLDLPGVTATALASPYPAAKFDLTLSLVESAGQVVGSIEYATALFDVETAHRFSGYLRHLLAEIAADPEQPAATLRLLDNEERRALVEHPAARQPQPIDSIQHLVEAHACDHPASVAVATDDSSLSYGELNTRANRLAHHLVAAGVGPDTRVAICADRGLELIVALLAILKAGGAYVPLDPAYPVARLDYMLRDSAPVLVLTQAHLRSRLPDGISPLVCLDMDTAWSDAPEHNPAVPRHPDQIAYVIYTSGSTGTPKGVAQTWRALDNLIGWQLRQATPARVLQYASVSFDVSVQEIWSTLAAGATLVVIDEARRRDLGELARYLRERDIGRAFLPTAVVMHLAAVTNSTASAESGCEIITAGEALRVDDGLRWLAPSLGGVHLANQYGPTETHVVTQHLLACADAPSWPAAPPIGTPISGSRLYVLDVALEPVPIGVVGELFIGGVSLARGYHDRPGLTAARFVPDPFDEAGTRMYRSGDLARRRSDGGFAYVGRADDQVKVRGFRVEPGEIEAVLRNVPGVGAAAVVVNDEHLVAYLTGAATTETGATVETAREHARRHLPEHMVPTRWVALETLPLTVNGKLDRRALPAPVPLAELEYQPPRTEPEQRMAEIWAEVLRVERVGAFDDFFALGGHSLLATRLIHALNQRMPANLSLRDLFATPVLADLAAVVTGAASGPVDAYPQIEPDPGGRYRPFPLTDIQEAYWVGRESTIELGGVGAHGYSEMRVRGFDEERFTRALHRLIDRHDMLRAVFSGDGRTQVLETVPAYQMTRLDLRGHDPVEAEKVLAELRDRMSHQLLDAACWPLFEFALTRLDGEDRLHISIDALIVDAASSQIFESELSALYADPDAPLPPVPVTFRDYVLAEHALRESPRSERALQYWRERAVTLPPGPALPIEHAPESIDRPHFTRHQRVIDDPQWSALKRIAAQHAVTPSVLLLTAFSAVLAQWSRRPHFTLSLPLFARLPLHPHINAVIGDFTSLVLLEIHVDDGDFATLARAVQERLWSDIDHSAVSGVQVNRELSRARGVRQTAMPVVFNSTLSELEPTLIAGPDLAAALGAELVHAITQTPQVWIDHTVLEASGQLHTSWDSIDDLFPPGLVAEMFAAYGALLDRLTVAEAWTRTPWPAAELVAAELAEAPQPGPLPLLHELFDRRAVAAPEAVAVISPLRRLTYRDLRLAARALAGRLHAKGVRPGELVAVAMDRGVEQVIAVLAILYAGGAYLPVDPALPTERIHHMLDRTDAWHVLVQPGRSIDLPDGVMPVVVDDAACQEGGPPVPTVVSEGDDLAYVIYTSGSTGAPKGVMIEHRAAVNTLLDIADRLAIGSADRILAISSLSFDLSVFDIFGAFAAGAAVVTLDPELARDPAHWVEVARVHHVSVWNSVPALAGMLVEYADTGQPLPSSLRVAMLSGDWIPLTLADRLRRHVPGIRVDSLGGATEASIWSIHFPIGYVDPAWRSIPYGRALSHQSVHVLDEALRPRPTWAVGEIYIGGAGVARGYWRDEERTAAAFVTHPSGARLYRTGDLGRVRPDGTIEFLGRDDDQVKIHGYRVELGEIEAALDAHPGVRASALRLIGERHGDKRLAAYIVSANGRLDDGAITDYLAGKLPAYAVPTSFTFLTALPLSVNGKVDRAQLPDPVVAPPDAPRDQSGEASARVHEIVAAVLGVDTIAPDANLLRLGATSIDIVRISNKLSTELGFRPKLAQLMAAPTMATLLRLYHDDAREQAIVASSRAVSEADPRSVVLTVPDFDIDARINSYRSVREFTPEPVGEAVLAELLSAFSVGQIEGVAKRLYASAGGTYPIQTYVYVKPDRVSDVDAGAYHYDPAAHRLVALGDDRILSPDTYDYFVNRPTFESAAFALFLVAEITAIEPRYGAASLGYCQIEAGAMAQLLTMTAAELRIGLCGIGSLDDTAIAVLFDLGPTHQLIYSMLGGISPYARPAIGPEVTAIDMAVGIDMVTAIETVARIETEELAEPLPVSFQQRALWFLDQLAPGNPFYNNPIAVELRGPLDVTALTESVTEVVRRHDALRTTFETVDGEPHQRVNPPRPVAIQVIDLTEHPVDLRAQLAREAVDADAHAGFDLACGPLLRTSLLRLADDEHYWLLNVHHIVADGWSVGLLLRDLTVAYAARVQADTPGLGAAVHGYPEYALWQRDQLRGETYQRHLDYWTAQLADAPTLLALPTDRPRPAVARFRGRCHTATLDVDTLRALRHTNADTTLFMTLMAALAVLLWRTSGQDDISVGTPFANRDSSELEEVIGHFINTLVIRTRLDPDQAFTELLGQVRRHVLDAYAHADLPFDQLVEALAPDRHASHSPLFQVMLVLQNMPTGGLALPGLTTRPIATSTEAARFDLSFEVAEREDGLHITLEFDTDLFDDATAARLADHYIRLLEEIAAAPHQAIGELRLLTATERARQLYDWNATKTPTMAGTLVDRFEAQAAATPQATALVDDDKCLDYETLNRRANRLAHSLRRRGVRADQIVGLRVHRSVDMVVGMLGILKAGAAYLPLEPTLPVPRLAAIIADARPAVVLSDSMTPPDGLRVPATVWLGLRSVENEAVRDDAPAVALHPSNLAYVIYTSGSTGRPKGAAVSHASVTNLVDHWLTLVGGTPTEAAMLWSSFAFDVSVHETFVPLLNGGALHIVPEQVRADPEALLEWAREHRIVAGYLPPAFVTWIDEAPSERLAGLSLRHLLVGVEPLPEQALHRIREARPELRIINGYGPTETTVYSTVYPDPQPLPRQCPIGRPLANTRVYVLDERGEPVPPGVIGEIYIGGVGMARGYLGQPSLTAARFVPDPFVVGERMYRTGDLGRIVPGGEGGLAFGDLEYVGRRDFQVKLRGYRIELGDVEAALLAQPGVREAAVLMDRPDGGEARLVAAVSRGGVEPMLPGEWRAALAERLPSYMIPALVIEVDRLPQTSNGKLDRTALLERAQAGGPIQVNTASPRDHVELALYEIWTRVLLEPAIGIGDNFFDIGGTSISAIKMVHSVRAAFDQSLLVSDVMLHPTIEALAARLRHGGPTKPVSNLIEFRAGDGKARVICVHPAGGTAFCYLSLAKALPKQYGVYGIQSPGLNPGEQRLDSIDAMASAYLELCEPFLDGELIITGLSYGGLIAYEMARRLSLRGHRDLSVVLLDTLGTDDADHRADIVPVDMAEFRDKLIKFNGMYPGIADEQIERYFTIYNHNRLTMCDYLAPPSSLRLVLLQATAGRDEAFLSEVRDFWRARAASDDFVVTQSHCDHWEMLETDEVRHVAALVTSELDRLASDLSPAVAP